MSTLQLQTQIVVAMRCTPNVVLSSGMCNTMIFENNSC